MFTPAELDYLRGQRLGRLSTIGPDGSPQTKPVGFVVDESAGTIDVAGRANPSTQKWRNIARDGRVSFLVDDLAPGGGWNPRVLEVRGTAELLPDEQPGGAFRGAAPGVIRIRPRRIVVFGIESGGPGSRSV
jgi:pyridoxamine 5'-phosphate oxidase family protein